ATPVCPLGLEGYGDPQPYWIARTWRSHAGPSPLRRAATDLRRLAARRQPQPHRPATAAVPALGAPPLSGLWPSRPGRPDAGLSRSHPARRPQPGTPASPPVARAAPVLGGALLAHPPGPPPPGGGRC